MQSTLRKHVMEHVRFGVADIILGISEACKGIADDIRSAPMKQMLGTAGYENGYGDDVQKLDVRAQDRLVDAAVATKHVAGVASEEMRSFHRVPASLRSGNFLLLLDPVDGSSNLGVNVSVGTIFGISQRVGIVGITRKEDFLQPSSDLLAAGYVIYGPSTVLVYSAGDGVHAFCLDPKTNRFILTDENIRTPERGRTYSVNEGNYTKWNRGMQVCVDQLKSEGGKAPKARYIGSLVADFHRNLMNGGVFFYPGDRSAPCGKLRLLYEAGPLAYLVHQAGGLASAGSVPILEIVPKDLGERTPLIIGSPRDVEEAQRYVSLGEKTLSVTRAGAMQARRRLATGA